MMDDLFNPERTEGMRRAVEHADRVEPNWSDEALKFLHGWAKGGKECGKGPFLIEQVIAVCRQYECLPEPPTTKAWGAVVKRAQKAGWLVKDGFAIGQGNACPKILWRHV